MSVFLVKHGLIAIGAEQDARHPFRGSSHLLTDYFQINAGDAFDDQLIMDMANDKAVPESFHGVNITVRRSRQSGVARATCPD